MLTEMLPELDHETYERARLARDAAYDGLFFVGVRTTRILLPSDLSGTPSQVGERGVLPDRRRCRADGLSPVSSLPP
jgi:hypothetical protein